MLHKITSYILRASSIIYTCYEKIKSSYDDAYRKYFSPKNLIRLQYISPTLYKCMYYNKSGEVTNMLVNKKSLDKLIKKKKFISVEQINNFTNNNIHILYANYCNRDITHLIQKYKTNLNNVTAGDLLYYFNKQCVIYPSYDKNEKLLVIDSDTLDEYLYEKKDVIKFM